MAHAPAGVPAGPRRGAPAADGRTRPARAAGGSIVSADEAPDRLPEGDERATVEAVRAALADLEGEIERLRQHTRIGGTAKVDRLARLHATRADLLKTWANVSGINLGGRPRSPEPEHLHGMVVVAQTEQTDPRKMFGPEAADGSCEDCEVVQHDGRGEAVAARAAAELERALAAPERPPPDDAARVPPDGDSADDADDGATHLAVEPVRPELTEGLPVHLCSAWHDGGRPASAECPDGYCWSRWSDGSAASVEDVAAARAERAHQRARDRAWSPLDGDRRVLRPDWVLPDGDDDEAGFPLDEARPFEGGFVPGRQPEAPERPPWQA